MGCLRRFRPGISIHVHAYAVTAQNRDVQVSRQYLVRTRFCTCCDIDPAMIAAPPGKICIIRPIDLISGCPAAAFPEISKIPSVG